MRIKEYILSRSGAIIVFVAFTATIAVLSVAGFILYKEI
jgi:hypothetical protein